MSGSETAQRVASEYPLTIKFLLVIATVALVLQIVDLWVNW